MIELFLNETYNHLLILSVSIMVVGVAFTLINNNLANINNVQNFVQERVVDSTRVHEGLPTDITLTPEDFRNHPELAEMFGVTDINNNLNLVLESNNHFETMRNLAIDYENFLNLIDTIREFLFSFF